MAHQRRDLVRGAIRIKFRGRLNETPGLGALRTSGQESSWGGNLALEPDSRGKCLLSGARRGTGGAAAVDEPDAGARNAHLARRTAVDDLDRGAALGVGKHDVVGEVMTRGQASAAPTSS